MREYLACLKSNQQKNEKCRTLSKKYLQCRFDACVDNSYAAAHFSAAQHG